MTGTSGAGVSQWMDGGRKKLNLSTEQEVEADVLFYI